MPARKHAVDMTREEHIARLERSMAKWREHKLDIAMPDSYRGFTEDLQALKDGADFKAYDDTETLLTLTGYIGGHIPEINYTVRGKRIPVKDPITVDKARQLAKWFLDNG